MSISVVISSSGREFVAQSTGRLMALESKSNRSCERRRITAIPRDAILARRTTDVRRGAPTRVDERNKIGRLATCGRSARPHSAS